MALEFDARTYQKNDDSGSGVPEQKQTTEVIKPVYTAYFVKDIQALTNKFSPIHSKVFAHHATIAFKPQDISSIKLGQTSTLLATGRVSDEKGDALILEGGNTQQKQLHVTLSCAEGVSPIYSNELIEKAMQEGRVEKIEPPVEIETLEGYFDGKVDVTTSHQ